MAEIHDKHKHDHRLCTGAKYISKGYLTFLTNYANLKAIKKNAVFWDATPSGSPKSHGA
jgi:hypothetical protein